jgi:hypothetical protein
MLFSGTRIGNYVRNMPGLFTHRLDSLSIRKHCRAQSPSYSHRDKNHLRMMEIDVCTTYMVVDVGRTLELVHGCSNRKKTCVCYNRSSPTTLFSYLASQIHANIYQQKWRPLLHPLTHHLLPAMCRLANHQAVARRTLYPALTARAEAK